MGWRTDGLASLGWVGTAWIMTGACPGGAFVGWELMHVTPSAACGSGSGWMGGSRMMGARYTHIHTHAGPHVQL